MKPAAAVAVPLTKDLRDEFIFDMAIWMIGFTETWGIKRMDRYYRSSIFLNLGTRLFMMDQAMI